MNKIFTFLMFLTIVACVSCNNYGKKIEYKGGELYYTDKVSETEAKKLGDYLVAENFFDPASPTVISVQLNKEGDTFQFRMVVKEGLEKDENNLKTFKVVMGELSEKVFAGGKVEIHLCDKTLKTLKAIPFEPTKETSLVRCTKLSFNGGDLYYTKSVSAEEANALGKLLTEDGFYDGSPKTVQLHKVNNNYQFRMVIKEEYLNDKEYVERVKLYSTLISIRIFNGAPVDFHFCDEFLNTLKEIPYGNSK